MDLLFGSAQGSGKIRLTIARGFLGTLTGTLVAYGESYRDYLGLEHDLICVYIHVLYYQTSCGSHVLGLYKIMPDFYHQQYVLVLVG